MQTNLDVPLGTYPSTLCIRTPIQVRIGTRYVNAGYVIEL